MRLIILILFIVPFHAYCAQDDTCRPNKNGIFHRTIWSYVSKVLPNEADDGKYNVFMVKFYHLDSSKLDISFTLGNIVNLTEYPNVEANHYFMLGKEIFLVNMHDSSFIQLLDGVDFYKLGAYVKDGPYNEVDIQQRLYPSQRKAGYILRHHIKTEMHSIRGCSVEKRYEGDMEQLPAEFQY